MVYTRPPDLKPGYGVSILMSGRLVPAELAVLLILLQPSSAAAECVFYPWNDSFNERQRQSLEDYNLRHR